MNLRGTRRREEPEINLTSLIDVVLLLVVFFMLSTTFNRPAEITLDLPKSASGVPPRAKQTVEILIDAQGGYHVNNQRVINTHIDTLKEAIRRVAGEAADPTAPFVITADAKSPHQAVVTAMDAAGQLGYVHLSIATQRPAEFGNATR